MNRELVGTNTGGILASPSHLKIAKHTVAIVTMLCDIHEQYYLCIMISELVSEVKTFPKKHIPRQPSLGMVLHTIISFL